MTPDGTASWSSDEDAGELVVLRRRESRLDAARRVPVGPGPGQRSGLRRRLPLLRGLPVVAARDGRGPRAAGGPKVRQSIPLPFPPGRQFLLPDPAKLVVADAFGGRLAVIDPARGEVESVRELPAHNIRGLAVSGDGRRCSSATRCSARGRRPAWRTSTGGTCSPTTSARCRSPRVRDPKADLLADSRLHHLGDAGRGAGDPAGVAVAPDGAGRARPGGGGRGGGRRAADGGWRALRRGPAADRGGGQPGRPARRSWPTRSPTPSRSST